jgi:hypothetical protein
MEETVSEKGDPPDRLPTGEELVDVAELQSQRRRSAAGVGKAGESALGSRGGRAEPVEGSHESGVGPCGGQDGAHVAECLLDGDTEVPRGIQGGDGRCAADPIDAMNQNGPSLSAKYRDSVGGLSEHQIQVGVVPRIGAVGQPNLDVIGRTHTWRWHFCAAKPAQRHDGIDALRRLPGGIDAAQQNQGVVRVDGEHVSILVGGVIEYAAAGPSVRPGLAVLSGAQREGDQIPAAKARPAMQDAPPRQRGR